jgi:molybdopterin/thiamine biosynthesis adenylyltransferase/rhodanese-related sulfurtransferase
MPRRGSQRHPPVFVQSWFRHFALHARAHISGMTAPDLSGDELARYARHLVLPGVGEAGQRRLTAARVLLVGAGGLGSPAALYLAAAGVGTLGIVDDDVVDASNLQRQVLHGTSSVGQPKVRSAAARLADVNPHVRVEQHATRLTRDNALDLVARYDIVVDGTDNFATRYLVNDACVLVGRVNVWGSVFRFEGQASVFAAANGPCYRCVFPEPPAPGTVPSCEAGGVFGVLPGIVGSIQAAQVLALLLGDDGFAGNAGDGVPAEPLVGRLLVVDALRMRFQTIAIPRDPQCPACGTRTITALQDYDALCGAPPSSHHASHDASRDDAGDAVHDDGRVPQLAPRELAARLARGDAIDVLDVREPWEHRIAQLPSSRLVPMNAVPQAAPAMDRDREIVVACHHGMRSLAVADWLKANGFRRVWNLAGGIDRWSAEVDASVPRY